MPITYNYGLDPKLVGLMAYGAGYNAAGETALQIEAQQQAQNKSIASGFLSQGMNMAYGAAMQSSQQAFAGTQSTQAQNAMMARQTMGQYGMTPDMMEDYSRATGTPSYDVTRDIERGRYTDQQQIDQAFQMGVDPRNAHLMQGGGGGGGQRLPFSQEPLGPGAGQIQTGQPMGPPIGAAAPGVQAAQAQRAQGMGPPIQAASPQVQQDQILSQFPGAQDVVEKKIAPGGRALITEGRKEVAAIQDAVANRSITPQQATLALPDAYNKIKRGSTAQFVPKEPPKYPQGQGVGEHWEFGGLVMSRKPDGTEFRVGEFTTWDPSKIPDLSKNIQYIGEQAYMWDGRKHVAVKQSSSESDMSPADRMEASDSLVEHMVKYGGWTRFKPEGTDIDRVSVNTPNGSRPINVNDINEAWKTFGVGAATTDQAIKTAEGMAEINVTDVVGEHSKKSQEERGSVKPPPQAPPVDISGVGQMTGGGRGRGGRGLGGDIASGFSGIGSTIRGMAPVGRGSPSPQMPPAEQIKILESMLPRAKTDQERKKITDQIQAFQQMGPPQSATQPAPQPQPQLAPPVTDHAEAIKKLEAGRAQVMMSNRAPKDKKALLARIDAEIEKHKAAK